MTTTYKEIASKTTYTLDELRDMLTRDNLALDCAPEWGDTQHYSLEEMGAESFDSLPDDEGDLPEYLAIRDDDEGVWWLYERQAD